jgi:SAM-dependent methyltransferase
MFDVRQVDRIRSWEIEAIADVFPSGASVLEIGAGTGQQAAWLAAGGLSVVAIDIPDSTYAADLIFDVRQYDGQTLPFDSGAFDVVYTSMLLEHLRDPASMHREIRRVLAPAGRVIHVVPTHVWRAWTTATSGPDAVVQLIAFGQRGVMATVRGVAGTLLPRRHGERGTILSETWLYHPRAWRRDLAANGFEVVMDRPMGCFYTGNMLLGSRLSMPRRAQLAGALGSASHVFVATPG